MSKRLKELAHYNKKSDNEYELIIDTKQIKTEPGQFYFSGSEMSNTGCLNPNTFSSCTIRNVPAMEIKASSLLGIMISLKEKAECKIILNQPLLVMQEYDAKLICANAKLAGFEEIETKQIFVNDEENQRKVETLQITMIKPEKEEKN